MGPTSSDTQLSGDVSLVLEHQPTLLSIGVTNSDGAEPSAAYGGGRVLVAYRQGLSDVSKKIRIALFDATTGSAVGAVSDVSPDGNHCDRPSVTFDGKNFWVAFRKVDGGHADLFGVRVAPDGTLLDSNAFAISADPETELAPVLAANAAGRVLLAYSRFDSAAGGARVKIRWVH